MRPQPVRGRWRRCALVATILLPLAACLPEPPTSDELAAPMANCEIRTMFEAVQEVPTLYVGTAANFCQMFVAWRGAPPELGVMQAAGKAVAMLQSAGVTGSEEAILADLMLIAETRGAKTGEAIIAAFDTAIRMYGLSEGDVPPKRLLAFLRGSGPLAVTMSDEGVLNLVEVIRQDPGSLRQARRSRR